MNDIQRYLVEEHIEEFNDGRISRRELVRRATLILGGAAAALAALAACGAQERPAGQAGATVAGAPAVTAVPAVGYATPPAAPTRDGVTVKPDDPRIVAQRIDVPASDGAKLIGYLARPKADGRYAGILVIHENRGLLEHIRDVVRRVATAGFVGIAVDLASRDGGADKLTDQAAYNAALGKRSADDFVSDARAALEYLVAQPFVAGDRLGITGFCFGGGVVWNAVASGLDLKAAVPFYGFEPSRPQGLATAKTAVFAVYADRDTRLTATWTNLEPQLKRSGRPFDHTVYPNTDHGFYNDTGARYAPQQAQQAWVAAIEWFRKYLAT